MKIKLTPKTYREFEALSPYENKKPIKQTPFWKAIMKFVSKKDLADCHFTYSEEGMEKLGVSVPGPDSGFGLLPYDASPG